MRAVTPVCGHLIGVGILPRWGEVGFHGWRAREVFSLQNVGDSVVFADGLTTALNLNMGEWNRLR